MKKQEWERLVAEQIASGESVASFCRTRGISDSALTYWRGKLKGKSTGGVGFVQLESGERISLELNGGKTIRVRRSDLPVVLEALCGR